MNKFSIVLVGLVVLLAGMVSVGAYFSSNQQAFVSAQITLDVDFGTVFVGETVIKDLTINGEYFKEEGDEYPLYYTLELGWDGTDIDMSPLLSMAKSTLEESEDDNELDGRSGDYFCLGTFDNDSDNDTWVVTLHEPVATGDYICHIDIYERVP